MSEWQQRTKTVPVPVLQKLSLEIEDLSVKQNLRKPIPTNVLNIEILLKAKTKTTKVGLAQWASG